MVIFRLIVSFSLVFPVHLAHATPVGTHCELELGQIFNTKHRDAEIYEEWSCDQNIANLLEYLKTSKIEIKSTQVLFIFRDLAARDLRPQATSMARRVNETWPFHVVLEKNGMIYDFDFTTNPIVVPARDYFASMFDYRQSVETLKTYLPAGEPTHFVVHYFSKYRRPNALSHIMMRVVSATDYVQYERRNFLVYDKNYPAISISDYLDAHAVE